MQVSSRKGISLRQCYSTIWWGPSQPPAGEGLLSCKWRFWKGLLWVHSYRGPSAAAAGEGLGSCLLLVAAEVSFCPCSQRTGPWRDLSESWILAESTACCHAASRPGPCLLHVIYLMLSFPLWLHRRCHAGTPRSNCTGQTPLLRKPHRHGKEACGAALDPSPRQHWLLPNTAASSLRVQA